MQALPKAILNGAWVDATKPILRSDDLALNRGYGVFDFFRTKNGIPLFIDEHLDRLMHSAAMMFLPVPFSLDKLKTQVQDVIDANRQPEVGVKVLLTGGYSKNGYTISAPNLLITAHALPTIADTIHPQGISVITFPYQRALPLAKTINYSMGIWLQHRLEAEGADDVIYVSGDAIHETPRSNVFIVTMDGTLKTPAAGVLAGITRKHVLTLAKNICNVEETNISPEELLQAREVFITSTTKRALPVYRINGQLMNNGKPGPVTQQIFHALVALENTLL